MADLRVVSVTGTNKISLAEAKNYLRVTNTMDDTLISSMIVNAHNMARTYLSKDILATSYEYFIPYVSQEFLLPFAPIDTTVTITVEVEGEATTFTTFGYDNPYIRLNDGSGRDIKVSYSTTGLGDEVKQGLLACVAYLYKAAGRGDIMEMKNVMSDYKSLLAPYRRLYI